MSHSSRRQYRLQTRDIRQHILQEAVSQEARRAQDFRKIRYTKCIECGIKLIINNDVDRNYKKKQITVPALQSKLS